MNQVRKDQLLRASILDRLIDLRPDQKTETEKQKHQLMNEMRDGVRRDLEILLNTRYRGVSPPAHCPELEASLVNYGLPDLNTFNFMSVVGRSEFCTIVEDHIKLFEPRFKSVHVTIPEERKIMGDSLNFRIEAIMYADPVPEELIFDSSLETISNIVHIGEVH